MASTYFTKLTTVGAKQIAAAQAGGSAVTWAKMVVGDGGGSATTPSVDQTKLVNQVYSGSITSLTVNPSDATQVIAQMVIPDTAGGWYVREIGIVDGSGNLVAVANCPESYKPSLSEGAGRTQVLRMVLAVSGDTDITIEASSDVVYALRDYVDGRFVPTLPGLATDKQVVNLVSGNGLYMWAKDSAGNEQTFRPQSYNDANYLSLVAAQGNAWQYTATSKEITLPSWASRVEIQIVGGGGGGCNCLAFDATATQNRSGGGGGAAGFSWGIISGAAGDKISITTGVGGTYQKDGTATIVQYKGSNVMVAGGGKGSVFGAGVNSSSGSGIGAGAAGGSASGGSILNMQGAYGSDGQAGGMSFAGNGANSQLGAGGRAGWGRGFDAVGAGGGGGGAYDPNNQGQTYYGGTGGNGIALYRFLP